MMKTNLGLFLVFFVMCFVAIVCFVAGYGMGVSVNPDHKIVDETITLDVVYNHWEDNNIVDGGFIKAHNGECYKLTSKAELQTGNLRYNDVLVLTLKSYNLAEGYKYHHYIFDDVYSNKLVTNVRRLK